MKYVFLILFYLTLTSCTADTIKITSTEDPNISISIPEDWHNFSKADLEHYFRLNYRGEKLGLYLQSIDGLNFAISKYGRDFTRPLPAITSRKIPHYKLMSSRKHLELIAKSSVEQNVNGKLESEITNVTVQNGDKYLTQKYSYDVNEGKETLRELCIIYLINKNNYTYIFEIQFLEDESIVTEKEMLEVINSVEVKNIPYTPPQISKLGTFHNNMYQNSFFPFTVQFSERLHLITAEQFKKLNDISFTLIKNKVMIEEMKNTTFNSEVLFSLSMYSPDLPVPSNPSLVCYSVNLRGLPHIKNGGDFLKVYQSGAKAIHDSFKPTNEINRVEINDVIFNQFNSTLLINNRNIKQSTYSIVIKEHAINCVLTYTKNENKKILEDVVKSFIF